MAYKIHDETCGKHEGMLFIRGEYVTHMKFRENPGNCLVLAKLGHSDLYLNNYWMSHVWYTPGGSRWRYVTNL